MRNLVEVKGGKNDRVYTHVLEWESIREQMNAVRAAADKDRIMYLDDVFPEIKLDYHWDFWHRPEKDLNTWDDVERAVGEPWETGMALYEEVRSKVDVLSLPTPRSMRRTGVWRDQDGDFEFDRFMGGNEAWRGVTRRVVAGQQFVTIAVQIGATGGTAGQRTIWRGLIASLAAEILESHGYSAEILAYDVGLGTLERVANEANHRDLVNAVWVKRTDEPLNAWELVNATSAWYFRIVNFASYSLVPYQKPRRGFGSEVTIRSDVVRLSTPANPLWIVDEVWNLQSAVKATRAFLETFLSAQANETDGVLRVRSAG